MDIIMVPFHDCKKWIGDGFRTRDAHLAEHFCTDSRVGKILVINRPTSLAESIIKQKKWKTSKLSHQIQVIQSDNRYEVGKLNEKLYYLDTFLPDFVKVIRERKLWWFSAFQEKYILESIKRAIGKLELRNVVLLLQNPMAVGVIGFMEYDCLAFDAIDNWIHHPQMKSNHKIIEKNYKIVENKADVIFTVSKALMNVFKENQNVHWVANGVDVSYFSTAIKYRHIDEIVTIGYVGKIQDRVDFELVERCLKEYKNMKFIFVGPIFSQAKKIKKIQRNNNNIKFLGDIHYADLPNVLKKIDVAIMPHKIDAFTDSMNPLKLYEYLASGKPVVSTTVAGTENISEYIFLADDLEFVKKLGMVCAKVRNGEISPLEVVESIPEECTWDFRTSEILNELEKVLPKGRY